MIKGFKGFDKNLKCRGFQYKKGEEYEHDGEVRACSEGFHSCENPMDVFNYYPPADSRYCEIEADGDISRDSSDSKLASRKIKVGLEIGIKGIVEAGVKFIFDKVDWTNAKESNDENQSAATNTGDQSAATNTGYQSAATNTGYRSSSSVEGKDSIAFAMGIESKAKGSLGCWIVLAEWYRDKDYNWHIKTVERAKVDGEIIKADTVYILEDGKFIEFESEEE